MARIEADVAVFWTKAGEVVTAERVVGGGRFTPLGMAWKALFTGRHV